MFFNLFNLANKKPFSNKARQEHDNKPTSSFFEKSTDKDNDLVSNSLVCVPFKIIQLVHTYIVYVTSIYSLSLQNSL